MKSSKIITIFIIFLFLLSSAVLANENYEISYENHYEYNNEIHENGISVDNENLFNYLIEQSKKGNEVINVLDYNIPESEAQAVITRFFLNEDVYYISNVSTESYDGDKLKEIRVSYIYSPDEIKEFDQKLQDVEKEFLNGANDDWNDIEKVLYTDIYICKKANFSTSNDYGAHSIIGALLENGAVSDGYSSAFNYLTKKLGLNSILVTSVQNEEAWNMVEIDGMYYHISCSNSDLAGIGKISYEFFLKSDTFMQDFGFEWDSDVTSEPEEEYEPDWIYGADTYLEYINGYWYFVFGDIDFVEIDRVDLKTNDLEYGNPIEDIQQEEIIWTSGFTYDGEKIYVSTNKDIYIIDYDFENQEAISFEKYYSLEDSQKLIYSVCYMDDKLYYCTTQIDEFGFTAEDSIEQNVYVKLLDISSDETEITIKQNSTYNLKIIKEPENATEKITWTSSNENIVSVSENGLIIGNEVGTADVIARFKDKEITYKITVEETENPITPIEPDPPVEPDPEVEITTLDVLEIDGITTIEFDVRTTIESIITEENFPVSQKSDYTITVLDQDDNEKGNWNSDFIGSKNTIVIKKDDENVAEFKTIVKGDVTGNGILRMYDALQMLKELVGNAKLDALDIIIRDHTSSNDNSFKMYDVLQFLKDAIRS